jgi:hypothetical protein
MHKRTLSLGVCVLVTGLIFIVSPSLASANGMAYIPSNEQNGGIETMEGESILTSVADENILYLGGNFTAIGYSVGRGAVVSATTPNLLIPDFPKIYAATGSGVDVVLKSQAGDIAYIGGKFFQIGDNVKDTNLNLVRTNPDGSIDATFLPKPNGEVRDLAITPDGAILYVAGDFTNIGGVARNHLAAINTATGAVDDWDPNANDAVYKLALSQDDNTLYVGGKFTSIASTTRNYIAALNTATSTLTAWDPGANDEVYSLALNNDDSILYVGGKFTNIATTSRNYIAALNTSTSTVTAWDPDADHSVREIVLNASGTLAYIGGDFTFIASTTRNHIAALDPSTSTPTTWNPNANNTVRKIVLNGAENTVYAGGDFTNIGGQVRSNLAALNTSTSTATDWRADTSGRVNAIVLDTNEEFIYIAGNFNTICLQARNNLAAINIHNNDILNFDPNSNGIVRTLALGNNGNTLYTGGDFTTIGGQARNHLAAIDTNIGAPTLWDPNPTIVVGTTSVFSIALDEPQSVIYIGGKFDHIGGQARNNLAAIGLFTGTSTDWSPNPDDEVDTLAMPPDPTAQVLLVSGKFTQILNATRTRFALLDTSTSTFADPDLVLEPDGVINSFAFKENRNLYFGGNFTNIGGQARNHLASFDPDTGNISDWNPNVNATGTVNSLFLYPGGNGIFVGGSFNQIGATTSTNNLAIVDTVTNEVWSWDNGLWNSADPSGPIYSLSSDPNSFNLFIGGNFTYIDNTRNLERHSFAVYTYSGIVVLTNGPFIAVTEGGPTDTFQLRLVGQPGLDVTLNLTVDSQVTVTPTSLIFTSQNWFIPQTITVRAVDDHEVEGNHTGTITASVITSDVHYNGMPWLDIIANITDNDTASNGPTGSMGGTLPSPTTTTTTKPVTTTTKSLSQMTSQELQAEVSRLTTLLIQLQDQLKEMMGQPSEQPSAISSIPESFKFTRNLQFGQILIDVKYLQMVLNSDSVTMVASTGPGSPGHETNYFGVLTKAAVIKFQEKYKDEVLTPFGLTTGTGFVGPLTRTKLNTLLGR